MTTRLKDGDIQQHYRLNTDAMFFYHSKNSEKKLCQFIIQRKYPPRIYKDKIRNLWISQPNPFQKFTLDSFTHAYIHLRKYMIDNVMSSQIDGIDITLYDQYFF
jgi:hypothetical protein